MERSINAATSDEEKLEILYTRVKKGEWWRFCRSFLGIENSTISAIKQNYVSDEDLYNLLYKWQRDFPRQFHSLLRQYRAQLDPNILNRALLLHATEQDITAGIYGIIDCVPHDSRRDFVRLKLGIQEIGPCQWDVNDVPVKLKKNMLQYWWERENHDPGFLDSLIEEAENQRFLKPQKEFIYAENIFQNIRDTNVTIIQGQPSLFQ